MATQAQPETRKLSPAQMKRVQELDRRVVLAQAAFNEFCAYLAEEQDFEMVDAAQWQLDVRGGAWVRVPATPAPNGKKEG